MKDNIENKLDELFDKNSKKSRRIILKTKIKSMVTIVIITSVILSVLYIIGTRIVVNRLNIKLGDKENIIVHDIENEYEIMHPNIYLGQEYFNTGVFSANVKIDTYKIIGQNVIHTEPVQRECNISGIIGTASQGVEYTDRSGKGISTIAPGSLHDKIKDVDFFNTLGQRKMIFFYPFSDYKYLYKNDISKLDQVDNKKIAEMALSFDKYYSMDEIINIIPKEINISWYWVDDLSEKQKSEILEDDESETKNIRESYDGTRKDGIFRHVVSEDNAIGIKAINLNGERIDNPADKFVESLYRNKYNMDNYTNEKLKNLINTLDIKKIDSSNNELNYNKKKLKVGGIVVTGSIEQLKVLKSIPNIKASTFGVIADKY